ncbi:hypothetical protein GALMADRAFT_146439 [Galerina marginata CBS 339.88]|uniref:BTB domain-containing protein n=1 Tax=Galerina marginata (strain CBS 339.88) TaxID=685588 RepID=A0A067SKD4_GALM3|nr:hypothetical protein GALMADRAFT_146439 [Galerina marginata CBS 339.88]
MSESLSSESASIRKRTTETGPANQDNVVRSLIWFEDGSIIIQATSTQFRVHKSVLSRNSRFFRDLFTVPQPKNEPTIEGCAIVHVADDPDDWQHVLEILYDNVKAYKSTRVVSLPMISGMLRLGRKYELDHLREEAIERLREDLPPTLILWDSQFGPNNKRTRPFTYEIFDLIDVLLDSGVQSLLPVAYYTCLSQYSLEQILEGLALADRPLLNLPLQAKISLALGRDALSRAITYSLDWLKENSLEGCSNRPSCTIARTLYLESAIRYWHAVLLFRPLGWAVWHNGHTIFCASCAQRVAKKIEASRQKVWEELPVYFRLPKWDDLKDD